MYYSNKFNPAGVVKLVDTPDLGSGGASCESSSLSACTIFLRQREEWFYAQLKVKKDECY